MKKAKSFFLAVVVLTLGVFLITCNNLAIDNAGDVDETELDNTNNVATISASRGGHIYSSDIYSISESVQRSVVSYQNYFVNVFKDGDPFITKGKLITFEENDIYIEGSEYIVRYIKIEGSWIVFILESEEDTTPGYQDYTADIHGGALTFEGRQPFDTELWEFTTFLDKLDAGKTLQEIVEMYLDFGYVPSEVPYNGDYLSCGPFRNYTTKEGVVVSDIDFGLYLCWGQEQGQTLTEDEQDTEYANAEIVYTVETVLSHLPVIMRVDKTYFVSSSTTVRVYNIFWKNQTNGNGSITYRYNIDDIDHTVGSSGDIAMLDEIARDIISDPAVIDILKLATGDITLLVEGKTANFTYYFYGHR
jgi:hypothetical protein